MTWPIDRPEYGSYNAYRVELGLFCNYGADYATWTYEQAYQVDALIQAGLHRFYYPPPPPLPAPPPKVIPPPHRWSFLTPAASLTTVTGVTTYALPADFAGGLDGFVFSAGAGQSPVTVVAEAELRSLAAKEAAVAAAPKFAAIRPVANSSGPIRWEAIFYPTPDAAYPLSYRYTIHPPPLSLENPFPVGGTLYTEAMLEAMLAVAEERVLKARGVHSEQFRVALDSAIALDQQTAPTAQTWPVVEPAYGTYGYLKRAAGQLLGFPANLYAWSYEQDRRVHGLVVRGVRGFYQPPPLPKERWAHEWSFLHPPLSLTLAASTSTYDLPADYADLLGPLTFEPGSSVFYDPVEIVAEYQVRQRLAERTSTGRPEIAAVRLKALQLGQPTRYEILFYPTPDQAYRLNGLYRVAPQELSDANPVPLGGPQHFHAILEACLAEAEREVGVADGAHAAAYLMALMAGVSADRQTACPPYIGRNRDPGEGIPLEDAIALAHGWDENIVTYNGVSY